MADGFDIPINTDDASKALADLLKKLDGFGSKADKVLDTFEKDTSKAFKGASRNASSLEGSLGSIANTLKGFGALAVGALGVGALKELTGAFGDAVKAAEEKEQALKGVENALARTGQFSADAVKEVSRFADELENTTGLADDTALKMFTLASSFTSNKDQAMKLVKAANDLSVATGKSLESSVTALGKSLTGTLGPLDEFDPSLKNFSKSALQAGAAIDSVTAKFGGAAAAQMQTFGGSIKGVENVIDDFKVSIGQLITQNPVIINLIQTFGEVLGDLGKIVDQNQDGIRSFMKDGIIFVLDGLSNLIPVAQLVVDAMGAIVKATAGAAQGILGIASAVTSFEPAADTVKFLIDQLASLANVVITVYQGFLKLPEGVLKLAGVDISGLGEALDGVKQTIDETNKSIQETDLSEGFNAAAQSVAAFSESAASSFGTVSGALEGAKTKLDGYVEKLKSIPASVNTTVTPVIKPGTAAPAAAGNGLPDSPDIERSLSAALARRLPDAMATAGQGLAEGLQQGGQAGAAKAVGGAASGIAQLAGAAGPVAGAIGSAIQLLGQDPESFKTMIQGFVDGIPIIIDNIVTNIPVLVETLANNLGPIITAIISGIPRIIVALIKAIPIVIQSILGQLSGGIGFQTDKIKQSGGQFFGKVTEAHKNFNAKIIEGVKNVVERFKSLITSQLNFQKKLAEKQLEFAKKIGEFIKGQIQKNIEFAKRIAEAGKTFANNVFSAFKRIKTAIDNMIQKIKDSFNIGGGGGKTGLGFAKGGIVPNRTLYAAGGAFVPKGTDTVPAMLTPGELVVPTDIVAGLRQMVNDQNSIDVRTGLVLLAKVADLLSQPMQVHTEAKVRGKVLADIMVDLDRRGARTTA